MTGSQSESHLGLPQDKTGEADESIIQRLRDLGCGKLAEEWRGQKYPCSSGAYKILQNRRSKTRRQVVGAMEMLQSVTTFVIRVRILHFLGENWLSGRHVVNFHLILS